MESNKEQKNSLSDTEPGKSHVYLLQTTGSSKISNQQLTSICQWFPGRHNFVSPPLPVTNTSPLTSTQGQHGSTRDIPGRQLALHRNTLEKDPDLLLLLLLLTWLKVLKSSPTL